MIQPSLLVYALVAVPVIPSLLYFIFAKDKESLLTKTAGGFCICCILFLFIFTSAHIGVTDEVFATETKVAVSQAIRTTSDNKVKVYKEISIGADVYRFEATNSDGSFSEYIIKVKDTKLFYGDFPAYFLTVEVTTICNPDYDMGIFGLLYQCDRGTTVSHYEIYLPRDTVLIEN